MTPRRTTSASIASPRVTRRQWTTLFAAAPLAAASLKAQVTSKNPPQGIPSPAPPNATPEQTLQNASSRVRRISDRLTQTEVPMDVEPAFTFRP